jgi:hypothetical protein
MRQHGKEGAETIAWAISPRYIPQSNGLAHAGYSEVVYVRTPRRMHANSLIATPSPIQDRNML